MLLAINSMFVLWSIITMTVVFLFWGVLHFALATCEADHMTRSLAHLFCLLLLLAGLALGVMIAKLPVP